MRRPIILMLLATLGLLFTGPAVAQEGGSAPDSVAAEEMPEVELSDLEKAQEILATVSSELDSVVVLQEASKTADNEKLELMRVQADRHTKLIGEVEPELLKIIPGLELGDQAAKVVIAGTEKYLIRKFDIYVDAVSWWARDIGALRELRDSTPPEEMAELEEKIFHARSRLDALLPELALVLEDADGIGVNTEEQWQAFDRAVRERAENLVGRLQIAKNSRDKLKKKIDNSVSAGIQSEDGALDAMLLKFAEDRVTGVAKSLEITADILGDRGMDTSIYRQTVFKTTGEISDKVLDPQVIWGLLKDAGRTVGQWISDKGPTILVRLLIVFAVVILFRLLFRFLWWLLRALRMINLTKLMVQLGDSLVSPLATIVGLFAGLWIIGANPATLLTGAGVAGVIIGFALQDSMANLAAGFFILATRPFDVDDVIRSGTVIGTVRAMWIANTTIVTFDGRRLLIPNRKIWADIIENRSVEPLRRADIVVRVGYDADLNGVIDILMDLLRNESRILDHPEPRVFVSAWKDSWVEVAVRPWTRNEDWWPLLTDLPRLVALRFREEGIEIPYPRFNMEGMPETPPEKPETPRQ